MVQGAEFDPDAFDVLTLDCYGTLIDWQGGIVSYLQPVLERHDAHVTDDFILEFFAESEPVLQREGDKYEDVLRRILDRFGTRLGFVPTPDERDGFPASLGEWKPFPDTVDALTRLAERYQLAVISNVDDALFSLTRTTLGVEFAHVITAEQAGAYKPDNRIFEAALTAIGSDRDRILHVAQSLFHDIAPANALKLATVWIDRNQGSQGAARESEAEPTWTYPTLGEFADAAVGLKGAMDISIEIAKEYLHFSAAHFTVFSATERENLHGHNFQVEATLRGRVGDDGLCFDYNVVKARLKTLCDALDEIVLLPGRCPHVDISVDEKHTYVVFNDERLQFLHRDAKVLPVRNVTVEELAHWLIGELTDDVEIAALPVTDIELRVSSGAGQWACAVWEST